MAFAAGALVFPGGRIDPGDEEAGRATGCGVDAAARIAAIRETIEETGIAAGLDPAPDAGTAAALREGLSGGAPFAALLEEAGLRLDLDALTPFARWCPNFRETRRFDTLFFLADAPANLPRASADRTESVRTFWASAACVLAEVDAGRAHVIFPTRRNLERLALFASIDEARAHAARYPVRKITPGSRTGTGGRSSAFPRMGLSVTWEPLESARRH